MQHPLGSESSNFLGSDFEPFVCWRSDILEFGAAFRFGSFTQSHKLPENPPQRFVPAIFSAEKAMAAWLQLIPAQVDQSFEHEAQKIVYRVP